MQILVVEDDKLLNSTLCYNLSIAGYDDVDSALTKATAMQLFTEKSMYLAQASDLKLQMQTAII